tara:strand:+ start:384 stop:1751 length:1368 start_codon:yes stop_codon:yes gene_type:complete
MDVLVVDDEKNIRDATIMALEAEDHYAEGVDGGPVALMRLNEDFFDLVLLDLRLGEENGLDVLRDIKKRYKNTDVVVFTAYGTVETAVKAMHLGAFDFLEKPFTPDALNGLLARLQKHRQMQSRIEELEVEVAEKSPEPVFESQDSLMTEVYEVLFRAAQTPASILVLGESGTGKSVVAKAVHQRSHLKSKPLVTISCPSLSKELLESELFGHVKGSFTGAIKDKWGKVHAAHGGTLFLDEIGELPLDIQPKLLRLLQEREYERLGENKTRQADVRIIAASNRNLKELVEEGEFREDLYYRLHVIAVEMPPLRSRPKDLVYFAEQYLRFFARQTGREITGFSENAKAWLTTYNWPGNLRELRNSIERAAILCRDSTVRVEDLPAGDGAPHVSKTQSAPHSAEFGPEVGSDATLEQLEEEHLRRILGRASSMVEAARILGIDQATLYRKRKKLGIE